MKVSVPYEEQETVINFLPSNVTDKANIYSADPHIIKRLKKLALKHPTEVILEKEDKYGVSYVIPRNWVSFKPKRHMSEEQKQKNAERLRKYAADRT